LSVLEPAISFRHAALKVKWANERIKNLEALCNDFLATKPYVAGIEDNAGGDFQIGMTRPVPPAIPLLMGDIVANIRSSLDYAWMGLVRAASGPKAKKRTLPIGDNRKGVIAMIADHPIGAAIEEAKRLLGDTIKSHRDFSDGGNRALAALNELANWNKHNMLIAQVGAVTAHATQVGSNLIMECRFIGNQPSNFGTAPEGTETRHYVEPTAEIVFGKHEFVESEAVIPTLISMSQVVGKALKAFCQAFPSEDNPHII
jgi:hypothetical protein